MITRVKAVIPRIREGRIVRAVIKAKIFRDNSITLANDYNSFKEIIKTKGGFISAHWDGTLETEEKIKKETKATIRCIPLEKSSEKGKCIISGKPSSQRVLFAISY